MGPPVGRKQNVKLTRVKTRLSFGTKVKKPYPLRPSYDRRRSIHTCHNVPSILDEPYSRLLICPDLSRFIFLPLSVV